MSPRLTQKALEEIDSTLQKAQKIQALVAYRREHGIVMKTLNKDDLAGFFESQHENVESVILRNQLQEIKKWFQNNIHSLYRRRAISGHQMDHFTNTIPLLKKFGFESICFIQEGFTPPQVGIDLYMNAEERAGFSGFMDEAGNLHFDDPEMEFIFPPNFRILLETSILAYYQDITVDFPPEENEERIDQVRGETITDIDGLHIDIAGNGPSEQQQRRPRRAHTRNMSESGKCPSPSQLAKGIENGFWTIEEHSEFHRIFPHATYVSPEQRDSDENIESSYAPKRLWFKTTAVKFLNEFFHHAMSDRHDK